MSLQHSLSRLQEIGVRHGCDKFTVHEFGPVYERYFAELSDQQLRLLEIGIGGENFDGGGASLKTWEEYFPAAAIFGIDIYEKSHLDTQRIKTLVCDQGDQAALVSLSNELGPFNIIIDDGSHRSIDTLRSFFVLFPRMVPGGYYVIEDIQTSYWPQYGGTSLATDFSETTVTWIKRMVDVINASEILWSGHPAFRSGFSASELHVHHNIAFIRRGESIEASAVLTEELRREWLAQDFANRKISEKLASNLSNDPEYLQRVLSMLMLLTA